MTDERRPVVTISAAYGAGGSQIGPRLADRLGVPFVDRAIPVAVAERLEIPVDSVVEREDVGPATFSRWLTHFAPAVQMFAGAVVLPDPGDVPDDDAFRSVTEQVLREYAQAGAGAVILGRAAAVVLRDEPGTLHVRLDGPADARLGQAMRLRGIDAETAREEMRVSDAAREAYVKHWYSVNPHEAGLYHVVLDTTALELEACAELLARAARLRVG